MDPTIYAELNKSWKTATKVTLGEEIGELSEYEEYLDEYMPPMKKAKSHISGKEVILPTSNYCDKAKFISEDEIKQTATPLNINEIKDIDSILEAITDKWEYTGNLLQGNSTFVESSDHIVNSHYIVRSITIGRSDHVLSSYRIGGGKSVFGSTNQGKGEFVVRCIRGGDLKRAFECHNTHKCSDILFSSYCMACHNMLFSFNQRNKKNCIGNLELPLDKFLDIKRKLLGEVRDELKKNKKFPSILELVPNEDPIVDVKIEVQKESEQGDMKPIEKAFSSTSKILLNKELTDIKSYEPWLSKYLSLPREITSAFGTPAALQSEEELSAYRLMPEKRIISQSEAEGLGKIKLNENEIESLEKIKRGLSKIGFIAAASMEERNSQVIKYYAARKYVNTYNVHRSSNCENSAITTSTHNTKFVFGSKLTRVSQFTIHCYNSGHLNRCFEVDTSDKCSDTYFSHNCEGLAEAMFCFNIKSKRYAIGNTELPPDKYKEIKKTILGQIGDELEKTKELKLDIYTIGCAKK